MASSTMDGSEYLQNRLRERKAENARSSANSKHSDPDNLPRRNNPGRDDVIFADDSTPPRRRASERVYQSSPVHATQPLTRTSQPRRTSNQVAGPAGGARGLGAREAEEQIDKLSKQNFNLKLEVYHRREKVAELEKKLEEVDRLRNDNTELLEQVEDLMQERDERDQAIDEAVILICDLEDQVRFLQDKIRSFEASPRADAHGSAEQFEPNDKGGEDSRSKRRRQDPKRLSVSPGVSQRMAEISSTPKSGPRHVPSFLRDERVGAHTLRSQYIDGNRQVRPIPSFGTLGTQSLADQQAELEDQMLLSPALSDISESELKSLYGHDVTVDKADDHPLLQDELATPTGGSSVSDRSRLARTNRWVNESAVHPSASPKSSRTPRGRPPQHYQSLSGVLYDTTVAANTKPTEGQQTRSTKSYSNEGYHRLRPISSGALYGQNLFPPTPDTMLTRETRPSTHSSSSVTVDRGKGEPSEVQAGDTSSENQHIERQQSFASGLYASNSTPHVQEPNVLYSDPNIAASSIPVAKHDGALQSYVANENDDVDSRRRRPAKPQRGRSFDPGMVRQDIQRDALIATPGSTDQPRSYAMRSRNPRHIHGASVALEDRPVPRRRSVSATPTQATFQEAHAVTKMDNAGRLALSSSSSIHHDDVPQQTHDATVSPARTTYRGHASRPGTPQQEATSLSQGELSPPEPPKHATLPSRSESRSGTTRPPDAFRQYVSKITRRNSSSTAANPASETASNASFHTPPSGPSQPPISSKGRSNSIGLRTRKLFHRRKSSASQRSPPTSPTQGRRRITSSSGEGDVAAGSRNTTFMDAAKAAMPHLDLVGNERKTPAGGISTGIPVLSNTQTRTAPSQASRSTERGRDGNEFVVGVDDTEAMSTSLAFGKGRQSSDVLGFPRRGREGRATSQRAREGANQ